MTELPNDVTENSAPASPPAPRRGLIGGWRSRLAALRAWYVGLTQRQRLIAMISGVVAAIVLVVAILIWYLIFRKPISELPGLNITIPPTYSYSISDVTRPLGVAVDEPRNRLYVTQSGGSRTVKVFDLEGNPLGELLPPQDGGTHTAFYVAIDSSSGNVYVTDRGALQLYVYDAAGKYLDTLRPQGVKAWGPLAVAVDKQGVIYVSDSNSLPQRVWAFKADGTLVTTFGERDGLSYSNGIAVLDGGGVVVSDSNHARVLFYRADGTLVDQLARGESDASIGMPRGLAVGSGSRLYVVDTTNHFVRVYKTDGDSLPAYATEFGEIGNGDGQFLFPNGVAADSHGHIYVTDRENNRLQVWTNR